MVMKPESPRMAKKEVGEEDEVKENAGVEDCAENFEGAANA